TITNGTGVVSVGALSGSGTTWTVALSSVTTGGNVTVEVANFETYDVTTTAQTVAVYKDTTVASTLVTAAAITGVTSPVALATPSTAIDNGTGFMAALTSWSPADAAFAYSTVYTATITLTATAGYTFSGDFTSTAEIAGFTVNTIAPTSFVSNNGTELVFTVAFPTTGAAPVAVTGITVEGAGSANTITTNNGTLQMVATVSPANASNQAVTWSVTPGTGNATISATGLLRAVSNGTVTVTATASDGSGVFGTFLITISGQIMAANATTPIPTLNPMMLMLLAFALAGLAFRQKRRRV
ncbi:MAG: Ig-like domain-containing protein, partial [Burkholderiales bacterium]|nr:Ig-like domain-containing protein [Burkholderiales bacterium]